MALIKCSECGKEISDKATTCIHCGNPITNNINNIFDKRKYLIVGGILLFIIILLVIKLLSSNSNNNINDNSSIIGKYQCDKYGRCQLGNKVILSENNICSLPDMPSIQSCTYTLSNDTIYINYTINGYANGQLDGSYNVVVHISNNSLTDENKYTYTKE